MYQLYFMKACFCSVNLPLLRLGSTPHFPAPPHIQECDRNSTMRLHLTECYCCNFCLHFVGLDWFMIGYDWLTNDWLWLHTVVSKNPLTTRVQGFSCIIIDNKTVWTICAWFGTELGHSRGDWGSCRRGYFCHTFMITGQIFCTELWQCAGIY